jgi:RNA-binding protein MEX3
LLQIKVPVKIVGLVVGSKGQTIKNIQQQTHTYIVTPSRDKEPVFEVTGLPENVQQCRRQIEAHIALRTGNMSNMMGNSMNGMNGNLLGNNDETVAPDLLQCLYNKGLESLFNYLEPNGGSGDNMSGNNMTNGNDCGQTTMSNNCMSNSSLSNGMGMGGCDQFITSNGVTMASSTGSNCSSSASTSSSTSSKSAVMIRPELINIWKSLGESIDCDEGIGESPNIWTLPTSNSIIGSRASPSTSASPTDSLLTGNSMKRECLVCGDKEVTAALVPCGHNLFCLDCANRICGPNGDHLCPVCNKIVIQAIRIIA